MDENTPVRTLSIVEDADPGDVTDFDPTFDEIMEYDPITLLPIEDSSYDPDSEVAELSSLVEESAGDAEEPEVSLADILQLLYEGIGELVEAANDLDRRLSIVEARPTFAESIRSRKTGH